MDDQVISDNKQFYLSVCSAVLFIISCVYAEIRAWKLFCPLESGYISLSFIFALQLIVATAISLECLFELYCLESMIEWGVRQFQIKRYVCDIFYLVVLSVFYVFFFRSVLIKTLTNKSRSLGKSAIFSKVASSLLYAILIFLIICFLLDLADEMLVVHFEDDNYKGRISYIYFSVIVASWCFVSYRICRLWQSHKKTGFLQFVLIQFIILAVLIAINKIDFFIVDNLIGWVSVEINRFYYILCFFNLVSFYKFLHIKTLSCDKLS